MKSENKSSRRGFLKKSLAVAAAAPIISSFEEKILLAQTQSPQNAVSEKPAVNMPMGTIGKVKISRIICGGNLISGYAHSRDLIYVSRLLKAYFTDEKIMETWSLCEQYGINTMIFNPHDPHAVAVYKKYRQNGGKIQYLAQLDPNPSDLGKNIKEAVDTGAVGALLVGNYGDAWTRENKLDLIARFIEIVKSEGIIAGVAGHEIRTVMAVEKAGIKPDFYMKTLHSENYWSKRRPDQNKEVIDNYAVDNYWCIDPEATIRYMSQVQRPWLAYKVLAAGAIHPRVGLKYAFENGADFCVVGMFDFQVAENAAITVEAVNAAKNRDRDWMA
ncbi:MAG: twin-arginine translocation signal domain-containing protein [Verrucomicrobiia bacterium]